jgi:hypothetical protein
MAAAGSGAQVEVVLAGRSRLQDGFKKILAKMMDARIKSGHDEWIIATQSARVMHAVTAGTVSL